jgi:peptide/nickel transport system substrate-binding protein
MNRWEELQLAAFEGKVSRRDFMRRAAALGITTTLASGILSSAGYAETPKKGGTLKLGMEGGSPSDSLDPRTYADSVMIGASLAACNCLIEFDASGKPTGELFESWDVKPGAAEWVFNVRKDVTFSNGKTLDADDCIYSIQIHRGETKSPAKGILAPIKEIKALNKNQVSITLTEGNADFPVILGDYHIIVVPKDFTDWDHLVGTGAYQLESAEYGVRLSFKRRDGAYWKPNRGNFDAVEIRNIQDVAARTAALQSGEIDGCNRLDARTVKLLMKDPALNVVRTKGTGNRFCFVTRVTDDPYTNKDLRTALKYAIDREKIIESVYNGFAVPGNDHMLDALNPFYNTKMPQRKYDPDKAAFYFKKAGVKMPIELQTSEGAWGSAVDCAQLYQESAKKAGIDINVKKVSGDGYWDNVWLKVPFCAVYWGRRMSADQAFTQVFGEKSDWNDTNWKVPEFQQLLKDARVETDPDKRKDLYWKAQEMIADDDGFICFAITDYLDGYSKKVAGVHPHGRYDMDDNRVAEKAWMA